MSLNKQKFKQLSSSFCLFPISFSVLVWWCSPSQYKYIIKYFLHFFFNSKEIINLRKRHSYSKRPPDSIYNAHRDLLTQCNITYSTPKLETILPNKIKLDKPFTNPLNKKVGFSLYVCSRKVYYRHCNNYNIPC